MVLQWSLQMNIPSHFCRMTMRNVRNEWEITWLQMKKNSAGIDNSVEKFVRDVRYSKREWRPPRE